MLRGAPKGIFVTVTRPGLSPSELPVGEVPGNLSPDVGSQTETFVQHPLNTAVKNTNPNFPDS
jgi:hypothetical protein